MTYGDAAPSLTYTTGGAGLANGDTLSGALATTASSAYNVGAYAITQGTLAASSNYSLTYVGNNVTIGQRALTIAANSQTMTYGDTAPALTYSTGGAGLVNGDTLSGALATAATATANVGTYAITQGSLSASSNYAITYSGNSVTIGARALTIAADAQTMTYGNAVPTLTYTIGGSGLANGDTLSGALATTATSNANVGTYAITQGSLTAGGNYVLTFAGNQANITQRAITITADPQTMAYGFSVPALTYTIGGQGLVATDVLTGALATSATSTSTIGTYAITRGSLVASGNYAFAYVGALLTIDALPAQTSTETPNVASRYIQAAEQETIIIEQKDQTPRGTITLCTNTSSTILTFAETEHANDNFNINSQTCAAAGQ